VSQIAKSAVETQVPATAAEVVAEHPWPAEWAQLGTPIEHYWLLDVAMPKSALWPYLSDTSEFNQRLKLAPMQFVERDGKLYGSQQRGGARMEWEEVPWEWEFDSGLQNTRVYSSGPLLVLRARFKVYASGPDACRVGVYFGGIAKNLFGKLVLRFGLRSLGSDFARVFTQLAQAHKQKQPVPPPAPPPVLAPEAQRRLYASCKELVQLDRIDKSLVDRIEQFIVTASDSTLSRIRVRELAHTWELPEHKVIEAFLYATRRGLFSLTWDAVCPHCRGARQQLAHLGELPQRATCEPCGIEFDATQPQSLEVNFALHPAIRAVEKIVYCAAEPARKPHIYVQRTLKPGDSLTLQLALDVGHYRLRTRGSKQYTLVDIDEGCTISELHCHDQLLETTVHVGPNPTLTLQNNGAKPCTFVLEQRSDDLKALRPKTLFALQPFRDLFSEESVAAGVQLDIGQQTILFTDIVGSTRFYETVGDGPAFYEVRKHFLKTYELIALNRGVVVKTIGDAVMGAFQDPAGALQAAIELQRAFDGKHAGSPLRMRISIHAGPCLAVNLNSNIDYFGSAVNLAAKLQSLVDAGEVVFTQACAKDPAVESLLAREEFAIEPVEFVMKWSGSSITTFRLNISGSRNAP
jgi:class 3 adenylate cyclase